MISLKSLLKTIKDAKITHVSGNVNPINDVEIIETELLLSDIQTLEKQFHKSEKLARSGDKTDQIKYSVNETNPRTRILSSKESQIFKDHFTPCIYKDICMISLLTGARQMELLSFKLSAHFDNYIIVHTKTKKSIKKKAIQLFDATPYIYREWSITRHQLNKYWGIEKNKYIDESKKIYIKRSN